jgi:hypothetical protein
VSGTDDGPVVNGAASSAGQEEGNMMAGVRGYAEEYWPDERLMPSDEPVYVARAFYMFGSLALSTCP